MSTLGAAHFAAALAALAFGSAVLMDRKGTNAHRALGTAYVVAMIATNVTALGLYRLTGYFGPFHALALGSLAVLARGVVVVLRRRPGWLSAHSHSMAWSYLGLLAAACAEIIARIPPVSRLIGSGLHALLLGLSIAVVFLVVGLVVLPRLLGRAQAHGSN